MSDHDAMHSEFSVDGEPAAAVTPVTHHELDALIGSWQEDPEFDAALAAFSQIEDGSW